MIQTEQLAQPNPIEVEQDHITIVQQPVVDRYVKTIFDTYKDEPAYGINVQILQGVEKDNILYDKTVWQGFFYERRIARTLKKAQRVAGALAIESTDQN